MIVVSDVSANLSAKWNLSRGLYYIFTAKWIFILKQKKKKKIE